MSLIFLGRNYFVSWHSKRYRLAKKKKKYNRIKIVLAEKEKTSLWLAQQLKMSPTTISKWCTNDNQPTVETLFKISRLLNVGVDELLNSVANTEL